MKCAKSLKSQGSILKEVVLMFDQMYYGNVKNTVSVKISGANENNELCNGLLLFMIVLLLYFRFQNDPLEARFSQYRLMNGSVVALKDTVCSEKFWKLKVCWSRRNGITKLKTDIDSLGISLNTLMLSSDSREVAVHNIAGFMQRNTRKKSRVVSVVKCTLRVP